MLEKNEFLWINPRQEWRRLLEIGNYPGESETVAHWIWGEGDQRFRCIYTGRLVRRNNRGVTIETYSLTGSRAVLHFSNVHLVPCTYTDVEAWRKRALNPSREAE